MFNERVPVHFHLDRSVIGFLSDNDQGVLGYEFFLQHSQFKDVSIGPVYQQYKLSSLAKQ